MKHAYIVHLYFYNPHIEFNMPYLFTSEKEAYRYGEYEFRTEEKLHHYSVEKIFKLQNRFYALKSK